MALTLGLLAVWSGACAGYKFMRAFEPLLIRSLAIDAQYIEFEESLPNNKHWQENMSILKGMAQEKSGLLEKLKTLSPPAPEQDLYNTLIEDLNNSVSYLDSETNFFHKNTEYGLWLANMIYEGMEKATPETRTAWANAKAEVLRLQAEMTAAADKCNSSQAKLAKLVVEKNLRRRPQPIKYAKYQRDHVGYKMK